MKGLDKHLLDIFLLYSSSGLVISREQVFALGCCFCRVSVHMHVVMLHLLDIFLLYRSSGLVISREQGLRYDAGFAVPVLMS